MSFRRCCLWFCVLLVFGLGAQAIAEHVSGVGLSRGFAWFFAGVATQIGVIIWLELAWSKASSPRLPSVWGVRQLRNYLWARRHRCKLRVRVIPPSKEAMVWAERWLRHVSLARPCRVCGTLTCRNAFTVDGAYVPRSIEVRITQDYVHVIPVD